MNPDSEKINLPISYKNLYTKFKRFEGILGHYYSRDQKSFLSILNISMSETFQQIIQVEDLELFLGLLPFSYDLRWEINEKKHHTSRFNTATNEDSMDLAVYFNFKCQEEELGKLEYLSAQQMKNALELREEKFSENLYKVCSAQLNILRQRCKDSKQLLKTFFSLGSEVLPSKRIEELKVKSKVSRFFLTPRITEKK